MDYEDLDQSVAEQRMRHLTRRLPKRYRDIAPKPPTLLLSSQPECLEADPAISHYPAQQSLVQAQVLPVRSVLKSLSNAFGLYRQYYAIHFPDHDPVENITPNDLIDTSPALSSNSQLTTITHIPTNHRFYSENGIGMTVKRNRSQASRIF